MSMATTIKFTEKYNNLGYIYMMKVNMEAVILGLVWHEWVFSR